MENNVPPVPPTVEDKTVAILSYLTLIGFIVADNGRRVRASPDWQ